MLESSGKVWKLSKLREHPLGGAAVAPGLLAQGNGQRPACQVEGNSGKEELVVKTLGNVWVHTNSKVSVQDARVLPGVTGQDKLQRVQ